MRSQDYHVEICSISLKPHSQEAEITCGSVDVNMTLIMALHGWMAICVSMAQQPGTSKTEGNPTISVKECTSNGCSIKDHKLVLDANWRWIHTEDSKNCYEGNMWDTSICADATTCAETCQVEAVDANDYANTYGVTSIPGGVKLSFVTGSNVGSRLFLLEDDEYKLFKLKNREFLGFKIKGTHDMK